MNPSSHIVFLGVDADAIAAEIRETTWSEVSIVARDGDAVVGWLIGDIDPARPVTAVARRRVVPLVDPCADTYVMSVPGIAGARLVGHRT